MPNVSTNHPTHTPIGADDKVESFTKDEKGTTPNEVIKCGCACDCENVVRKPKFSVFIEHLRCKKCSTPTHFEHFKNKPQTSEVNNRNKPASSHSSTGRVQSHYHVSEEEELLAQEARLEVRRELWRNAWKTWTSRIPQKFQQATTTDPGNDLIRKKIQQLETHRSSFDTAGLLIRGKVGRGKTWLAVGYANDLIRKGLLHPTQVLFGSESKLLASAANAAYKDVEKELRELTSGKYKMIIIDDIGRGTWLREDMRPKVFSLVFDQQWADGNTVVATTNLSRKELSDYMGSAAMDRLLSMCGYAPDIIMEGTDQRKEQTNQRLRNVRNPQH